MPEDVCVFYLARAAEGIQPFVDFATSFRRFASGKPHRLVVIYKGFDAEPETPLKAIRDDHLFVSDDLTDIGSYIEAAEQFTSEYVCFFNTFSVILAPNWLYSLHMAIARNSVGIAGATASWESIHDTFAYLGKAIWLTETKKTPVHVGMMRQFGPYLRLHSPVWTSRYLATPMTTKWRSFFRAPYTASDEIGFPEYWKSVTAPGGPLDAYRDIPRFPKSTHPQQRFYHSSRRPSGGISRDRTRKARSPSFRERSAKHDRKDHGDWQVCGRRGPQRANLPAPRMAAKRHVSSRPPIQSIVRR